MTDGVSGSLCVEAFARAALAHFTHQEACFWLSVIFIKPQATHGIGRDEIVAPFKAHQDTYSVHSPFHNSESHNIAHQQEPEPGHSIPIPGMRVRSWPAFLIAILTTVGWGVVEYYKSHSLPLTVLATLMIALLVFLPLTRRKGQIFALVAVVLSGPIALWLWRVGPSHHYYFLVSRPQTILFLCLWTLSLLGVLAACLFYQAKVSRPWLASWATLAAFDVAGALIWFEGVVSFPQCTGSANHSNYFFIHILFAGLFFLLPWSYFRTCAIDCWHASREKNTALGLLGVGFSFFITCFAVTACAPGFTEASVRWRVSYQRTTTRIAAELIESFREEHGEYWPGREYFGPAGSEFRKAHGTKDTTLLIDPYEQPRDPNQWRQPCICREETIILGGNCYFYTDGQGFWMLISNGPDCKRDLTIQACREEARRPLTPSIELLVNYSYDPTNGTISQGDLWRVKQ